MKQYEDKFIVINKKHLIGLSTIMTDRLAAVINDLDLPENKYYVCNQDEPYAQQIIDIILHEQKQTP